MLKLRVYACGGAGTNIVKAAEQFKTEPGYAAMNPVFVDTSTSNITEAMAKDDIFIVPNVNGSGGVRTENVKEIHKVIEPMLEKYPPAEFNVVVFSGSGGSGSTVATKVLTTLLQAGVPAVGVMVGTVESGRATHNTVETWKTLNKAVRVLNVPIALGYFLQDNQTTRSSADEQAMRMVTALRMIASGDNEEMDRRDLHNFVFVNETTGGRSALMTIEMFTGDAEIDLETPISIAEVLPTKDTLLRNANAIYRTTGYPRSNDKITPISLATTPEFINDIIDDLSEKGIDSNTALAALNKSNALDEALDDEDESLNAFF